MRPTRAVRKRVAIVAQRRSYTLFAPPRLRVGKWSRLAATFDGTTLRTYVNGRKVSARRGAPAGGGGRLVIGAGFTGLIDDVRVWDAALPATRLKRRKVRGIAKRKLR